MNEPTTKRPVPALVREYFASLGRIGGTRASREAKRRSGRMGGLMKASNIRKRLEEKQSNGTSRPASLSAPIEH